MRAFLFSYKNETIIFVCKNEDLFLYKEYYKIPDLIEPMIVNLPATFILKGKKDFSIPEYVEIK